MSLARVDLLTAPPEIGERYRAPAVFATWLGSKPQRWPIIGPKHDDAELIGFAPVHYHIDGRFLTNRQTIMAEKHAQKHFRRVGGQYRPESCALFIAGHPITMTMIEPLRSPRFVVRRCRALATGFAAVLPSDKFLCWPKLQAAFAQTRLRRHGGQWFCPHRGAPLGSCPVEADGTIICPLHGLRWHAGSGLPAPDRRRLGKGAGAG